MSEHLVIIRMKLWLEWIFKEFILLRNITGDGHRHITTAGPRQTVEKKPPFFKS